MGLFIVQLIIALLTLNALWPPRNPYVGAVASLPAMLVSEAVGWVLLLTVVVTATYVGVAGELDGLGKVGVVFAVLNVLGQLLLIHRARRVAPTAEAALADGLGTTPAPIPGLSLRTLLLPFALRSKKVRVEKDLAYGDAPKKRNLLNVYRPTGVTPAMAPVLVQIHGGTWMYGNKDQQGRPLLNTMVEQGWIGVSINYRLSPANAWPVHIVDVKRALAWVKEHIAEYGGDPDNIVVTGGSAGGHLSALAALSSNDPAYQPGFEDADTSVVGAVPLYGVYDVAAITDVASAPGLRDFLARRIFQKDAAEHLDEFVAASPVARVTPDAPDFFVLHGLSDTTADIEQSRVFVEKLRATSAANVTYCEVPGAQHMFDTFHSIRCDAVVDAISQWLVATNARRAKPPSPTD